MLDDIRTVVIVEKASEKRKKVLLVWILCRRLNQNFGHVLLPFILDDPRNFPLTSRTRAVENR
jgi:hypothetical protein